MPIGGKLVLKGGQTLGGVSKKKQKKHKKVAVQEETEDLKQELQEQDQQQPAAPGQAPKPNPQGINVGGKTYEEEFELETRRMAAPKVKNTPWGSSYRAAPEILHGYTTKVTGATASERLDMRAATKADKFCK